MFLRRKNKKRQYLLDVSVILLSDGRYSTGIKYVGKAGIVMRRKDREITAEEKIREILAKSKIVHLGLFDGDYTYVVPLHYGYEYEGGRLVLYAHSAREGHKLDLIRQNPKVGFEVECDIELISGGDIACQYGSAYASVIGRGKAEIVEDPAEKLRGLQLLMKNQTGREFPLNEQMAAAVAVLRITADSYTAKSRPIPEVKK